MNTATYCPEDNKLRLYVGRVPRDEYLKLRADGWVSTPKQSCDFVATWTPSRRDTCLEYADIIEDEDQSPDERAADRAERFGEYRDKRTGEATGHADRYDEQPLAHGYQNQARAERAAARHDRIGDGAVDAWSKAEYWQRRTAGVISHALYKSTPSVRMGRIKVLEAELRKQRSDIEDRKRRFANWKKIAAITDPAKQTEIARIYAGSSGDYWGKYIHPTTGREGSLWDLMRNDYPDPITGAQACALWFACHNEPADDNDWTIHLTLRLQYENQMLEAQGGRAAFVEMIPGGKIGDRLIVKVNKSPATGRIVSVFVKGPRVTGWQYKTRNVSGADYSLHQIETERLPENAYSPPTPESLAELQALQDERKEMTKQTKAKIPPCPLINPTDADAERLQALWNEQAKAKFLESSYAKYSPEFKGSTVCRITQAVYSANSKGSYARAETKKLCARAILEPRQYFHNYEQQAREAEERGPALCQIRITSGDGNTTNAAKRVIVLTDKPQKPLPGSVWTKPIKFWNCGCGFQSESSLFSKGDICPECGEDLHDDTQAVNQIRKEIA